MVKIISKARLKKLTELVLEHGHHASFDKGVCAMEAVAWLAREGHSDHPECTCPVIAAFVRRFNDRLRTDNERNTLLRPLLPVLVGTRSSRAVMINRGYMAADWSVRIVLSMLCRALEWNDQAVVLESLPSVVDRASALRARSVAKDVHKQVCEKYDAAVAAYAASAADVAAYAAADVADVAGRKRLASVRDDLNTSAVDLIRRMCAGA